MLGELNGRSSDSYIGETCRYLSQTSVTNIQNALCLLIEKISLYDFNKYQSLSDGMLTALTDSSSLNIVKQKHEIVKVNSSDIQQFIKMVDNSCLEIGYSSMAEEYYLSICREKGYPYGLQLMNDIYIQQPGNVLLMCAMMNILSHIEYKQLGSIAVTLCMGLIATGTPEIDEYVINAIDRWNHRDFLECLKNIRTESFLLKRMLKKAINRLSEL